MMHLTPRQKELEINRQLVHLSFGLFISLLISLELFNVQIFTAILFISIIISFFSKFFDFPLLNKILDKFERPNDRKNFPGKGFITFLIGTISSYIIFGVLLHNRFAALLSVLALTIADSFPSLYGIMFGKIKNPLNKKKTIEGPIFAILFLTFVFFLFLPFIYAFLISIIVVLLETLEIKIFGKVMDDNIYLPLITGTIIILLNTL